VTAYNKLDFCCRSGILGSMLDGIGAPPLVGKFSIRRFLHLLLFLLLVLLLPSRVEASSRIDFSEAKEFFKELKVGEIADGDLSNGFPNPYEEGGMVMGYKLALGKEVDQSAMKLTVQSCAFRMSVLCLGSSFAEKIYVYDGKFNTIGDEFKFKNSIDMEKIKLPEDRTLYLLVGTDNASATGQFLISASLKETTK